MFKVNKFISKKASIICTVVLLTGILSGCYFMPKEDKEILPPLVESKEITYPTVKVKKGNIENNLNITGNFVSISQANLSFKNRGGIIKGVYVKSGAMVKAGDLLAELDTDNLEYDIKQQEINLQIKEIEYEVKVSNPQTKREDLEVAKLHLKSEQMKLDNLKQQRELSKIYSPFSGKVKVDNVNIGDYMNANKVFISVADTTNILLEYKDNKAGSFYTGNAVNVMYKNVDYKGEVVMAPTDSDVEKSDNLKNVVRISVESLPDTVKVGDTAQVTLTLEKKDNTIVIPRSVIDTYNGKVFVQVLEKDIKVERFIELGIQTQSEVEVVKGLSDGEDIVLR